MVLRVKVRYLPSLIPLPCQTDPASRGDHNPRDVPHVEIVFSSKHLISGVNDFAGELTPSPDPAPPAQARLAAEVLLVPHAALRVRRVPEVPEGVAELAQAWRAGASAEGSELKERLGADFEQVRRA